jgi:hypothetical protein
MTSKCSLIALAALGASCTAALAEFDLGSPAASTPYDRYMRPVKQTLCSLRGRESDLKRAEALLRIGRSFRYSFTDPYTAALPEVTARTKAGDCKAKSLWLMDQLGDASVRYVIGKARANSKISHAWVMWNDGNAWWILDPTNTNRPILADRVASHEYIPLYSWTKTGSYRHSASVIGVAAVASKARRTPPATAERG